MARKNTYSCVHDSIKKLINTQIARIHTKIEFNINSKTLKELNSVPRKNYTSKKLTIYIIRITIIRLEKKQQFSI